LINREVSFMRSAELLVDFVFNVRNLTCVVIRHVRPGMQHVGVQDVLIFAKSVVSDF
jgi:hypothetical protein